MLGTTDKTLISNERLQELEHKAAMFDFLAHTVTEYKCEGTWFYQDGEKSVEKFTKVVMMNIDIMVPDEDEEDDDN